MTDNERIRHNARILLPRVRGKTRFQRKALYDALRMGPLFWPVVVILLAKQTPAANEMRKH